MANIMITKRCNLQCQYCFANEFVNPENIGNAASTDISIENFNKILDFILKDGTEKKLGLIGGEPTLHDKFNEILDILINDDRIDEVVIYTNGIKLSEYLDKIRNNKIHLLINCNDIEKNRQIYLQFMDSIKGVFSVMKDRIVLGVNFYKPDYNYKYILDLLNQYPCKRLRVSISVPNSTLYAYEPLEYFEKLKPYIFNFFRRLKQIGTIPFLDCNIFPACLISAGEMKEFDEWGLDNPLLKIKSRQTGCIPVIDILPDFTAVRCFGMSEYTKVRMNDFASISDLRSYYIRIVDAYAVNSTYNPKCKECYKFKTIKCSGGCLIYKIDKILNKRMVDTF